MRFRPCIDLHEGKVKQIIGSTLSNECAGSVNFVSERDSDYYADLYRRHNLTGGHIIMLGRGNEEAAAKALAAWPGGMQIGGGVTLENAGRYIEQGASAVIVTSLIFRDGRLDFEMLEKLSKLVGRDKLVLDLSCRRHDPANAIYYIVTDRWQKFTNIQVGRETFELLAQYAVEFLIHAVDVEGKRCGIDSTLLAIMSDEAPITCVYAGGISSPADIQLIENRGKGKIDFTVGSALDIFGGEISFEALARDYSR